MISYLPNRHFYSEEGRRGSPTGHQVKQGNRPGPPSSGSGRTIKGSVGVCSVSPLGEASLLSLSSFFRFASPL
ncbi:hypothetical protein BHE74_00047741 [Ensete ventricosum]|nr:hypothetical protein BHE74_00047741 [Ensete ventricosum]